MWDRLSLSREAQRSSYKSCSWRCWRTCNLFQKCFHGIQRLNPNRCMRMGVRKHYGMYRFMQTALIIIRWRLTESTPDRVVDKEQKRKEMSGPWLDNREGKEMEKTQKYGPLMWELREKNPSYQVKQFNILVIFSWCESSSEGTCWREECHHFTKNAEICHIEHTKHCAKFQNSCLNKEDCCSSVLFLGKDCYVYCFFFISIIKTFSMILPKILS